MKRDWYEKSRTKHQLLTKQIRGVPYVVWSLTDEMRDYVSDTMNLPVIPFVISIKTKELNRVSPKSDKIIKEISYAARSRQQQIVRVCHNPEILSILDRHGISWRTIKYKIILN